MKQAVAQFSLAVLACILCAGVSLSLMASQQPPATEPRQRDTFGSSLKRLKWSPERQSAVEIRRGEEYPSALEQNVIKLESMLIELDVFVTDMGATRFISELARDDFLITEDGATQQISFFSSASDIRAPRSIILIIDWSSSQAPYLPNSIKGAKLLVTLLNDADEMAIVTDDVELLCDFTRDKNQLHRVLDRLQRRASSMQEFGQSRQFSALYATLRELVKTREKHSFIIFQTDGDEWKGLRDANHAPLNKSFQTEYGFGDIRNAAEDSRATVYTVIPSTRLIGLPEREMMKRGEKMFYRFERFMREKVAGRQLDEHFYERYSLQMIHGQVEDFASGQAHASEIASVTGGWTAFLEKPEQAEEIYRRILSDMNHRYLIGYYPTNDKHDRTRRHVKIEVRGHPDYVVHGRTSYIAPKE